tara:strand:+ start:1039 stop:1746 length:708 start_codon:yes stop_codon:yes gene_type:complete
MKMLVLAGGFGTRLKKAVSEVPKILAPVNNIPLLQIQLEHWISQGQKSFIFLLHYRADLVIDFLKSLSNDILKGIEVNWIVEKSPLGTGGSVKFAINKMNLDELILVVNADTWLSSGLEFIREEPTSAIGVVAVKDTSRYGSVAFNKKGLVVDFVEKKHSIDDISGYINAGLYKLDTNIFRKIDSKVFSLEKKILPNLAKNGDLKAKIIDTVFYDIGIPEDLNAFCLWHKEYLRN